MIDNTGGNPGDKSAANIIKIINAAADAKTAQTELQKQIMLKQIGDKMDIQKVEDQKTANLNWATGGMGNPSEPSGTPHGSPLNSNSGIADSGTPSAVGGQPPLAGQPSQNAFDMAKPTPPMTMADPAQQPANNAASQMSMAPQPAQPPQIPQGVSIPSPIGRPLPPPQGNIIMGPDGKPMLNPNANSPDNQHYSQIYGKWKSGQPLSDGESKWLQTKFSNGPDGQPLAKNNADTTTPNMTPFQKGIMNIKAKMGPQYTLDGDGNVVQDPIYMSLIKAKQDAQANVDAHEPEVQQARQDRLYNQAVSDIATKQVSYRSGSIGVQGSKVDQAIHASQLIDQAFDPKTGQYNITQVPYGELSETLGSLLSGGTGTSDARISALKQATLQGDFNKVLTYFTGKPSNATSQDALKQLVSIVDRQGLTAEQIRDGDVNRLKHAVLDGSGLSDDRKQMMFNAPSIGANYNDFQKNTNYYKYNNPQSFKSEVEASAAGLADGTRVSINGQTGTWRNN